MVKLTGPMHSHRASGTLANVLTFGKTGNTNTLRKKPRPSALPTGLQISIRAMLAFLSKQWSSLSAADIATWHNIFEDPTIPNYNNFIAYNITRWRNFKTPTKAYPPAETGFPAFYQTLSATGAVRHVTLATALQTNPADNWGVIIHHSPTAPPTCKLENAKFIIHIDTLTTINTTHQPLPAGTHYYLQSMFTIDGVHDTLATYPDSAVVT